MKKIKKLTKKKIQEDLEFARRTEEAYKRYEKGEFISSPVRKFLKIMKNGKLSKSM